MDLLIRGARYRGRVPRPDPDAAAYLPATVAEAAHRFGDRPAFVDPDGSVTTYRQLHDRSDAVAAGMARAGVRPRSIVALTLDSRAAWVLAYLAAAKLGATTAGVNPRLTDPERRACLDRVEPDLVLGDAEAVEALAVANGRPDPIEADADRPVAIVFTSGTTGQPKGAWFTDRQLTAISGYDVGDTWGSGPLPQFGSTQFAHVGFTTKLAWYLRLGTTTHLLARWRAGDVLDLVAREGIPTIGAVAPQVALMLRDPDFDQRDLSAVRQLVVGGAASPPAMVAEARRRFDAGYSIRWSATETGGVGTGTAPDAPDDEALHTVGRPRPGIDIEIRSPDGRTISSTITSDGGDDSGELQQRNQLLEAEAEVGEVWIRSDASMAGYWRDPTASAEVLQGGWLRTGDLGRLRHDGCLVLAGRNSDLYIRGGYNVFPAEVAAVLGRHPGVAEAAVVARADDVLGEIGVAVIVPRDRAVAPTLAELRYFAGRELAHHKLPEEVVVVPQLPLTAMSKVDVRALRAMVTQSDPGDLP